MYARTHTHVHMYMHVVAIAYFVLYLQIAAVFDQALHYVQVVPPNCQMYGRTPTLLIKHMSVQSIN